MNRALLLSLLAVARLDPNDPDDRAIERWRVAHDEALKKRGPARYELSDVAFYANDVDIPNDLSGPATSAVVTERTSVGRACTVALRELELLRKGEQVSVGKERLMGEDCCDLDRCATRTASGWMVHLARLCRGEDYDEKVRRLALLIDPKRPIRIEITVSNEPPGPQPDNRWKRADAGDLCNLEVAKFACEDGSPRARRFTCSTAYPGEHYEFVWRRTPAGALIERIGGYLEN